MRVLRDICWLKGGKARCWSRALPLDTYLDMLPPPKREAGEGGGTERAPSGGARLIAQEPWLYDHVSGLWEHRRRPKIRREPGSESSDDTSDPGDEGVEDLPIPEPARMAAEIYEILAAARAECKHVDLQ